MLYCSHADMAELVDALDLGSSVFRRVGSSPIRRTERKSQAHVCHDAWLFLFLSFIIDDNSNNSKHLYYNCCLSCSITVIVL